MNEKLVYILLITGILLWFPLVGSIYHICGILKRKKELIETQKDMMKRKINENFIHKLDGTERVLGFITTLIQIEVNSKLASLRLLNINYNILNLDNDVKEIGEKVFAAINKENAFFDKASLLIDDEYLMNFIITYSNIMFTTSMKEYNMRLYMEKAEM